MTPLVLPEKAGEIPHQTIPHSEIAVPRIVASDLDSKESRFPLGNNFAKGAILVSTLRDRHFARAF
ncbi:hypothetical protein [Nostoc parmelioides]|uniref:Uncharacterized protein n=1 Tax=Nostoc parmelioides FACHB-3921 TaxID=2692909 RepID=A0ABR8BPB5_9NOSO|nr:hypothetical protein [Nostoc parmelioides]MBD2255828.1 hypothetical protein [Nostoc parmelioides FACHB-3921]